MGADYRSARLTAGSTAEAFEYAYDAAGNRILAEETLTSTTLYLHGRDCLGEFRAGDWLHYLPDAARLVRQGTDEQGDLVSTWLFDPDGAVLEGPAGPVREGKGKTWVKKHRISTVSTED